ncbi:hypothetical protein CMI47_20995 [Candidatus Pacearchaeota archaeon]|nr:hypothetical protein [Candidatus Pacearchaeota archaeon]|tara:strand:+ start:711 stop:1031 length:321 start_codon:yes stop_codon:yes gene_type:complete
MWKWMVGRVDSELIRLWGAGIIKTERNKPMHIEYRGILDRRTGENIATMVLDDNPRANNQVVFNRGYFSDPMHVREFKDLALAMKDERYKSNFEWDVFLEKINFIN